MDNELFDDIIEEIKLSLPEKSTSVELSDEYNAFNLNKVNFKKIELIKSNKKIAFVDGGNAEILGAPNFSLHFIRIYYTIYQNNKRIKNKKFEFYALATAFTENQEIKFKTKLFGDKILDEQRLIFNSNDKTLKTGKNRFSISKIGEIARRFAELKVAEGIEADFVVLDGDLEENITNEGFYLRNLSDKSKQKGTTVCAISKTSRLFTNMGDSLNSVLSQMAPDFPWYYHPVLSFKNSNLDVLFVKLNEKSSYIFKLQFLNKIGMGLLSILMENSKDPVFLGYPYGLIEADKFARISNKEKEYLRTVFMAKSGKEWGFLSKYLKSVDAHDLLDRIS